MAKYQKKTNYREKYPGLSDEIIEVLEKSDRKMEYQQYDLKIEKYKMDSVTGTIKIFPSREDSYDRLLEENRQFAIDEECVDDVAVKAVLIEKMQACTKLLTPEDQELITELFYEGKSEREYGNQIGISQRGVSKRKYKILNKLKKMMNI